MFRRGFTRVLYKCKFVKVIKKDDIIQNFKTAIASTIKSLSKKEKVEVVFGNEKNSLNWKLKVDSKRHKVHLGTLKKTSNNI